MADGYLFMSCLGFPTPDGVSVVNRSTDDGLTWTAAQGGLPTGSNFVARDLAVVGDTLFLAANIATHFDYLLVEGRLGKMVSACPLPSRHFEGRSWLRSRSA